MRREAKEAALREANNVIIPLLSIARRYSQLLFKLANETLHLRVLQTGDKRVNIVLVEPPASRPLVVAVYSSVQESRPVSPSQLHRRLVRLRKLVNKLRGRYFASADIIYIYMTRVRLTINAYRMARRAGVYVALGSQHAKRILSRYFMKRVKGLLKKLQGRRIWGKLALLLYMLHELVKAFSPEHIELKLDYNVVLAYEKGILLPP